MTSEPLTFQGHPLRLTYVADAMNVHTYRWVRYFLDRGCECKVVSYRLGVIPGAEVYVHSIPPAGLNRLPIMKQLYTIADYKRVRAMLRWADIVNVHYIYKYRFNILYKNIPRLVVSTWGTDIVRNTENPPSESELYWQKFVLKRARVVTVLSEYLAEETRKFAPFVKDIHVIYFGVDFDRFDPSQFPRRAVNETPFRIGFLKHLRPRYGPDTLIEATRILKDRGYPVRTIIAGEGEDEDRIRKLIRDLGVSRIVDLVGRIPHEEVPAFLASLDVFCMPSRQESFGVAAVEAEAMEIPVVATNIGGIPEAVKDKVSGLLVKPDDPKALASAIAKLLTDQKMRAAMGVAGREYVRKNFDWLENAGRMEAVYRSLIS